MPVCTQMRLMCIVLLNGMRNMVQACFVQHIFFLPLLLWCVQAQWTKAMNACGMLLLHTREAGLSLIKEMESTGERLAPGTFRVLESVVNPNDFTTIVDRVVRSMLPTVTNFKEEVGDVLQDRWWDWAIMHPKLDESKIHPSRRMLPLVHQCPVLCVASLAGIDMK